MQFAVVCLLLVLQLGEHPVEVCLDGLQEEGVLEDPLHGLEQVIFEGQDMAKGGHDGPTL